MFGSIFYGQSMTLKIACSNPSFNSDLVRKVRFCILNRSTDKINFTKLFFVNYVRVGTSSSLQYFIWLKLKDSGKYILGN